MPKTIPIACTLDQASRRDRVGVMAELGESLLAVEAEGRAASLSFAPERRESLEDFVRVESACCAFFEFELTTGADGTRLRVSAPEGADWAVRGLVAGFVAGWRGLT